MIWKIFLHDINHFGKPPVLHGSPVDNFGSTLEKQLCAIKGQFINGEIKGRRILPVLVISPRAEETMKRVAVLVEQCCNPLVAAVKTICPFLSEHCSKTCRVYILPVPYLSWKKNNFPFDMVVEFSDNLVANDYIIMSNTALGSPFNCSTLWRRRFICYEVLISWRESMGNCTPSEFRP